MNRPNPLSVAFQGLILIASFIAVWQALAQIYPQSWNYKPEISIEDEERLGKILVNAYVNDQDIVRNAETERIINDIGRRLQAQIPGSKYHYKFYVVQSPEVNAFTLPGGNIVIFTGLIDKADNTEQIAGVIAHEMGHAENRHVVNKIVKELGLTAIIAIAAGDNGGQIAGILKQIISTSFDRDQEREADDFALKTMVAAKLSPTNLADFFGKMENPLGKTLEIMATHPDNEERIDKARKYPVPADFKQEPFAEDDAIDTLKKSIQQLPAANGF